jgi:hypothetical protein
VLFLRDYRQGILTEVSKNCRDAMQPERNGYKTNIIVFRCLIERKTLAIRMQLSTAGSAGPILACVREGQRQQESRSELDEKLST